jgi:hypothetical protein
MNFHNASERPMDFLDSLLKKVVPPYLDVVESPEQKNLVEFYEKTNKNMPVIRWFKDKQTFTLRGDIKSKVDMYAPLTDREFEMVFKTWFVKHYGMVI